MPVKPRTTMYNRRACDSTSAYLRHRKRRKLVSGAQQSRRGTFLLYFLLYVIIFEEVVEVCAGRDYYDILGVTRDADAGTIKKAFRKLAIKYHPDKNPGDKTAEKMYVELNNAYEVLGDSEKRQRYDMYGEDGLKGAGGDQEEGFDPFEDFWGMGGQQRRRRQERRVPDLTIPLAVELETLYSGGIIEASHKRRVMCTSWSDCEKKCSQCGGQGVVIQTRRIGPGFIQRIQTTCPLCGGTGKIGVRNCRSCPNGQFEDSEKIIMIDIEKGMPDGKAIVFEGLTDEVPDHIPGNLQFQVVTQEHDRFERDGDDLHYHQDISLEEALTGVDREVKQLDGRMVQIKTDKVISPNEEIRIKGEGMPLVDGDGAGDMIVKFWVQFPKELTVDQKKLVSQLFGHSSLKGADTATSGKDDL